MSDQLTPGEERDLVTVGLIDSVISRAERILARDLAAPAVQRALIRLSQDKTVELLLDKAATAATVAQFDLGDVFNVDIKETPEAEQ